VAVDEEMAGVRGMETEADPVGEMLPILEPTGRHRPVVQVSREAVPEIEKDVAGKKAGEGLVMLRAVGIKVVLCIVITLVGLEDSDSGIEKVSVFAGMVKVLDAPAEVVMVIVCDVVDLALKVRRPVNRVLVVMP